MAGFSSKLSTTNLASSVYIKKIDESKAKPFDIYVKAGEHVLFFIKKEGEKIITREATADGDAEKTKLFHRLEIDLEKYDLRRFNGW